jgi:hypothetical protein
MNNKDQQTARPVNRNNSNNNDDQMSSLLSFIQFLQESSARSASLPPVAATADADMPSSINNMMQFSEMTVQLYPAHDRNISSFERKQRLCRIIQDAINLVDEADFESDMEEGW